MSGVTRHQPPSDARVELLRVGVVGGGPDHFCQSWPVGTSIFEVRAEAGLVAAEQWPAYLPGPLDATHGFTEHEVAVAFDVDPALLDGADGQELTVRLRYHASHGPQPPLEVRINGYGAWLHPVIERADRTEAYMPTLIAGVVDRVLSFPASVLQASGNLLQISTRHPLEGPADAPTTRPHRAWYGHLFGSVLEWDSLEVSLGAALSREPIAAAVRATCLSPWTDDGSVRSRLEVLVTASESLPDAVHLLIDGHPNPIRLRLPHGHPGRGDARWLVDVPELTSPTPARLEFDEPGGPAVSESCVVSPARPWTVHVIPHVHLDVGYTDHQGAVVEIHARNLDRILGRDFDQYPFTIDGSFVVEAFAETRPPAALDLLLDELRAGNLSMNAYRVLFLAGVVCLEELYRATTFAFELAEQAGVPIAYANLTDVPAYPGALISALAQLGIGNFLGIQNHFRASTATSDELHLASPFRWVGPDGGEVVAFLADQYGQVRWLGADPPSVAGLEDGLARMLARYQDAPAPLLDIPLIGISADNEDIGDGDAFLVDEWNRTYAYPRLQWSTPAAYFAAIGPARSALPVVRGDGGSWWEDGLGAAAAGVAGYRQAQETQLAAEGLSALVCQHAPGLAAPARALRAGWDALLMGAEHTWTSAHATQFPDSEQAYDQLAWKLQQIDAALTSARSQVHRAMCQLGELIDRPAPFLLVVNLASWPRAVEAEAEIPGDLQPVLDGTPVPHSVVWELPGLRRVRIRVPDVPALGYRTLALVPAPRHSGTGRGRDGALDDRSDLGDGIELDDRIEIDPGHGHIRQLRDASGRPLLDEDHGYGLGQLLYVTGGGSDHGRGWSDPTTLFDRRPPRELPDLRTVPMRIEGVERTQDDLATSVRTIASGPQVPWVMTEVRVPHDGSVIEVQVTFDKVPELAKESVYVAFPFAARQPQLRYSRAVGYVDPQADHLPGAGNEWICVGDWAAVTDLADGHTIAWSSAQAPLLAVGEFVHGRWPEQFTPSGLLLSWPMNNYWTTNTPPQQGGRLTLRYAFEPMAAFDAVRAHRLGRQLRMPALARVVRPIDKFARRGGPLADSGSLLDLQCSPTVDAYPVSGPMDAALMIRCRELAGAAGRVTAPSGWHLLPCHPVTGKPTGTAASEIALQAWTVRSARLVPAAT